MSTSEVKQPFRIPTEEDYTAATAVTSEEFNLEGGAWLQYHRQSITLARKSIGLVTNFTSLSRIARLIEPIKDDTYEPYDPMFGATHAFRAGMWTGNRLKEHIYNGRIAFSDTVNFIARNLPHNDYLTSMDQEDYESNGERLRAMGHSGLELVGLTAREAINVWSEDIVSQAEHRDEFSYGAGAFLLAAHDIYKNAYPALKENYVIAQLSDLDDIERLASEGPDSSRT
jgi:hypothetical protein